MATFGPEPPDDALAAERDAWIERHDTRERVRQVVTGIREPAPAAAIAGRAGCSTNAARKHLNELVEERLVLKQDDARGARYRRNDEYFRWRRAFDLSREYAETALLDRLTELERRADAYRDRFDASTPAGVDFPPADRPHGELHDRWEALNDWETVRRDIALHEDALRLSRRRGGEPRPAD